MEGAREGEDLPFAHGEVRAPLADLLVQAVGQPGLQPRAAHLGQGAVHVPTRAVTGAECDVLAHRAREEEHVLEHQPDLPPQILPVDGPDVAAPAAGGREGRAWSTTPPPPPARPGPGGPPLPPYQRISASAIAPITSTTGKKTA